MNMKIREKFDKRLFLCGACEIIGTMILVFVGCGSVALTTEVLFQEGQLLVNGLAFGITLICLYYGLSNVSGAHLNPAVSFAMYINKKMTFKQCAVYMLCQFIGAAIGAGFLELLFFDANVNLNALGATTINEGMINYDTLGLFIAFFMETFFSFIFIFVYLTVTNHNKHKAMNGVVIGMAYSAIQFLGFMFTGASANPARSFGPAMFAMVNGVFTPAIQLWLYILAPLVGAAIACAVSSIIKMGADQIENIKRDDEK